MQVYHLDMFDSISPEKEIIEPITITSITDCPEIANHPELSDITRNFCNGKFPKGLGKFGYNYMHSCNGLALNLLEFVKESTLEYVRQLNFPDKVSRFECIFGIKTPLYVKRWYKNLCDYYEIKQKYIKLYKSHKLNPYVYILDIGDNLYSETDVYWRDKKIKSPVIFKTSEGKLIEKQIEDFNMAYEYYIACQYWSDREVPELESDYSLKELLITLPVKVIKKISYNEFSQKY